MTVHPAAVETSTLITRSGGRKRTAVHLSVSSHPPPRQIAFKVFNARFTHADAAFSQNSSASDESNWPVTGPFAFTMTTNSSALQFAWGPPDANVLSFSNCTLAVRFYLSFMLEYNYPYEAGGAFLLNGLSPYLQNNSLANPPLYELAHWYESQRGVNQSARFNSSLSATLVQFTEEQCPQLLCPVVGWQGNADVAGRGMLVTYFVQALLVAIYLPILLYIRFSTVPRRIRLSPGFGGFVLAVQHSATTFLNASFVFAIAMLLAGIGSCAQIFGQITTSSLYSPFMFTIMAFYSTIPPLLIQMAASKMLRRQRGRRMIWFFISILVITMTMLAFAVFQAFADALGKPLNTLTRIQQNQEYWQRKCAYRPGGVSGYPIFGFWFLSFFVAIIYIIRVVILAFWKRKANSARKHWKCWRIWWWASLVFGFAAMCFILAWFIVYNVKMQRRGGDSDQDQEWSFGQILSLATWLPVVIEMAYIWWETPAEAINGRLMDPFEVVDVSKSADMEEEELVHTSYREQQVGETERLAGANF